MAAPIRVSAFIARYLAERGFAACFTVTGGGAMHLNDAIGRSEVIRSYYLHHEQACAMAAEGYARTTGSPALVSVTSGPGSTNAVTGVLGAWLDSVPMLVLSGQMKTETTLASTPIPLRQLGFQEFNIIDSVRGMTKYAAMITDARYVSYHLDRAMHEMNAGRKGPVWLDIPLDIQAATIDPDAQIRYPLSVPEHLPAYVRRINPALVEQVVERVNGASSPVLMVGYGVRMSNAWPDFLAAVETLKIPVVTEWNANDLIWDRHPYFAGRPGTIGDRGGNFVVQNADCLLTIGCQLSIRQISYAWQNFARDAFVIGVNPEPEELIKPTIRTDLPIVADVGDFLRALAASGLASTHGPDTAWYRWCKDVNARHPVVAPDRPARRQVEVYRFFDRLSSALAEGDQVVLANGAACVAGLQALRIKAGQRVFTNAGASSMGYAIAAAVGVAAAGDTAAQLICVEGDGSIQMNLQELQTIVHHVLGIKLFWLNNGGYQSIKQTQKAMFNAKERGYCGADADSGISFPSAERIAAAYGLPFFRIAQPADLDATLDAVLRAEGPLLCEVVTDPEEEFQPKLQSRLLPDGTFVTPSLEDMYPFLPRDEFESIRFSPPASAVRDGAGNTSSHS